MKSTLKDDKLVVYIERTFGVLAICVFLVFLLCYEVLFFMDKVMGGKVDLWSVVTLFFTLMCLVLLWQNEETAVFDRISSTIRLEKRFIPCQPAKAYVWPLEECNEISVELEPEDPNFQRLVLSFSSGKSTPLTESFLLTKGGMFNEKGAGLMECKKQIKQFLKKQR